MAEKEKTSTVKKVTLASQIISSLWIAAWSAYKFISDPAATTITDIALSGISVAICFSPVYLNMFFDKIKTIRWNQE